MLGRSWEPGKATIVERRATLLGSGEDHTRYKFVLDVEVPGKPPFRATLKSPSWLPDKFAAPFPGQVVPVKADAQRQKAKWDRSKEANATVLQDSVARSQGLTPERQPPAGSSSSGSPS